MPASFLPRSEFGAKPNRPATLLPFEFARLEGERYLLTNIAGDYCVLRREDLVHLVEGRISPENPVYATLKARQFIVDERSSVALELLAARYRTRQRHLPDLASLHIVVVTLRCNSACTYCQASKRESADTSFDMSADTADRVVDFVFQSPSSDLKIEFQGGEPLLRFDVVQRIIERAERVNQSHGRRLEFVICSNLTLLTPEILKYCGEHNVYFSTSIDGPEVLHDANRPIPGCDGYRRTVAGIRRVQDTLGPDKVSALMTTTRASLEYPEAIIDEYIRLGFTGVFLRKLNPYGRAAHEQAAFAYTVDEWLAFYKRALDYILDINYAGVPFREYFASLLLRRMLTSFGTGFVDLQSPTGSGTSVLAYNFDGAIYASDEGRMLAAMGDHEFKLGDVSTDSYVDVISSEQWLRLVRDTMVEGVPGCVDCAYAMWCGSDPVRHYRLQRDRVGHKATSDWCRKHTEVMRHLVLLLEDDGRAAGVLRAWAN